MHKKRHIHNNACAYNTIKAKPTWDACHFVFCEHVAVNCSSSDDSAREILHIVFLLSSALFDRSTCLAQRERGGRGRVSQDYISGGNSHIHHNEEKKDRISTKSQGETQTNRARDILPKNRTLAIYKQFLWHHCPSLSVCVHVCLSPKQLTL